MFVTGVTAASRAVPATRVPVRFGFLPLADVANGERRDGGPERVIRRQDAVIPVPVLARRRHEVGEPVEKLKRREVDDDARPGPRGLSAVAGPDPVGRLVSREHVADFGCVAACVAGHGEAFEREGWPGAVSQGRADPLPVSVRVLMRAADEITRRRTACRRRRAMVRVPREEVADMVNPRGLARV